MFTASDLIGLAVCVALIWAGVRALVRDERDR